MSIDFHPEKLFTGKLRDGFLPNPVKNAHASGVQAHASTPNYLDVLVGAARDEQRGVGGNV